MEKNIIALVEPEIPYNTGNVARTCVITNTRLLLVRPLGFRLTDQKIHRAGMDYWPQVDLEIVDSIEDFQKEMEDLVREKSYVPYYIETNGKKNISQMDLAKQPCLLVFGSESSGLPKEFLAAHPERCLRIPMRRTERSLNLSNACAIALYEALRQQSYPGLH